jgi:hypothetical protein
MVSLQIEMGNRKAISVNVLSPDPGLRRPVSDGVGQWGVYREP